MLNDQKLSDTIAQRAVILNNIIEQKQLRNIIIDGIILSDIPYAIRFFNVNLYILINTTLYKQFPNYQSNIYRYINNTLYQFFPNNYIQIILKHISVKLKLWLLQSCKRELTIINKNIIHI